MGFAEHASTVNAAVLRTLGEDAVYTDVSAGVQATIRAVYSAPYAEQSGSYGAVASQDPRIETSESELSDAGVAADRDDEVKVAGETYAVTHVERDGHGWVTLHMEVMA